jgi:hypothetical protein
MWATASEFIPCASGSAGRIFPRGWREEKNLKRIKRGHEREWQRSRKGFASKKEYGGEKMRRSFTG